MHDIPSRDKVKPSGQSQMKEPIRFWQRPGAGHTSSRWTEQQDNQHQEYKHMQFSLPADNKHRKDMTNYLPFTRKNLTFLLNPLSRLNQLSIKIQAKKDFGQDMFHLRALINVPALLAIRGESVSISTLTYKRSLSIATPTIDTQTHINETLVHICKNKECSRWCSHIDTVRLTQMPMPLS